MSRFSELLYGLSNRSVHPCIEDERNVYTYADLLAELDCWQLRLTHANIGHGVVVGIRADYSLSAVSALLALLKCNAIVALLPRDQEEGRYLTDGCVEVLLEIDIDGRYHLRKVEHPRCHVMLDRLRAVGDAGIILFTSGSTGHPKAALQSLERFLYKFRRAGPALRTLAFLLFDHVGGIDTLFRTLANGGSMILVRRRDPAAVLRIIESHKVEVLPTSPSFLRMICMAEAPQRHDVSSLKIITYGSEPMDAPTLERLNLRFPSTKIAQKYGTTETGSPRSVSRANNSLWVKIVEEGLESKVIDGILWLRGEGTMIGYLNAPSPIDVDGWYCTGDVVDVDGEWIRFVGRQVDTINVGGNKVSPTEVEHVILGLDFVRDVLVSGESHAVLGQIVTARVLLTSGVTHSKELVASIRLRCRQHLAPYKVPMKIEVVTDGFANARHKMQRPKASSDRK